MDRAMSEIYEFLSVSHREFGIHAASYMTSIRRHCYVASRQWFHHGGITDVACPYTIACTDQLAVPVFRGHPDLNFDIGISSWSKCGGYAAKGRGFFKNRKCFWPAHHKPATWRRELPCFNKRC